MKVCQWLHQFQDGLYITSASSYFSYLSFFRRAQQADIKALTAKISICDGEFLGNLVDAVRIDIEPVFFAYGFSNRCQ
jgi:hypothetical protein